MERVVTTPDRALREVGAVASRIVGAVAVGIDDFAFTAAQITNAQSCTVSAHEGGVNFLLSGGNPTILLGVPLAAGETAIINGRYSVQRLRLIRNSATDANVSIQLEWNLEDNG